jgi:hypothetical protein
VKGGLMVLEIRRIFRNNDLMVGLVFLVFGVILLQQTLLIDVPESRLFPYITIGIILISGIALVIRGIIQKQSGNTGVFKLAKKELIILAMLLITYFAINILGFYTSIYLFLIVSYLYIEGTWSKPAVTTSLIFNTILIMILYLSFTVFLGMTTPTGLFL